jgi:hypothetical protein
MDEDYVLLHGLERKLWLMQYQYAHDGHDYQATPRGNITRNWNAAGNISVGDWCAAYLTACGSLLFWAGLGIVANVLG